MTVPSKTKSIELSARCKERNYPKNYKRAFLWQLSRPSSFITGDLGPWISKSRPKTALSPSRKTKEKKINWTKSLKSVLTSSYNTQKK